MNAFVVHVSDCVAATTAYSYDFNDAWVVHFEVELYAAGLIELYACGPIIIVVGHIAEREMNGDIVEFERYR